MPHKSISFAFFGTGPLAESVLASLVRGGYIPKLIVTKPDSPSGRHMQLTSPHIKVWGEMKGINVFQPESLKDILSGSPLHGDFDIFIIASYGKLIPDSILSIPKHGTLNVHPSLLPLYRGPSPIESVLLDGYITTGVTIIKLDNEMDHGPILVQNAFDIDPEITAGKMEVLCGQIGGDLLVQVLPSYIDGTLKLKEQDHSKATFCKKITKDMGEVTLVTSAIVVRRKFRSLSPWPGIFFFTKHHDKQIRVKIADVDLVTPIEITEMAGEVIKSVIPEGKSEMDWESFKRGYMK
ncbi:methionyl-tRNA formyltransferase [Candidatus Gracilibacteria bacterium]|nr:methionyl-tRNA formyltransferase [Candidatus Gracilibacteria bacterium]MCF7898681.1 methionyl-tRNA formyltransferase [Candidatus Paceibacterota bacterium]